MAPALLESHARLLEAARRLNNAVEGAMYPLSVLVDARAAIAAAEKLAVKR
jgi:hypothetical protein